MTKGALGGFASEYDAGTGNGVNISVLCPPIITIIITVADPEHSESEYRFIDIGLSESGRYLVVSYTERGIKIRIISSRLALPAERVLYEKG